MDLVDLLDLVDMVNLIDLMKEVKEVEAMKYGLMLSPGSGSGSGSKDMLVKILSYMMLWYFRMKLSEPSGYPMLALRDKN